MKSNSWIETSFFVFLFGGAMMIGLMIPTLYDWSGADQSRSSPEATRAFYEISAIVLAALLALPWIPSVRHPEKEAGLESQQRLR